MKGKDCECVAELRSSTAHGCCLSTALDDGATWNLLRVIDVQRTCMPAQGTLGLIPGCRGHCAMLIRSNSKQAGIIFIGQKCILLHIAFRHGDQVGRGCLPAAGAAGTSDHVISPASALHSFTISPAGQNDLSIPQCSLDSDLRISRTQTTFNDSRST